MAEATLMNSHEMVCMYVSFTLTPTFMIDCID